MGDIYNAKELKEYAFLTLLFNIMLSNLECINICERVQFRQPEHE